MMHSSCIAAFRTQNRSFHRPQQGHKALVSATPRFTALAGRHIHQCIRRQASDAAIPAFYTLCGYLVPEGNVEQTCVPVTCPHCLRLSSPDAAAA